MLIAALSVGMAKSGIGGLGLLAVLLLAVVFPAKASTGVLLPLLIAADVFAVAMFRRHAQWHFLPMLLPPAVVGVVAGWWLMPRISDGVFAPVIGVIVLAMIAVHYLRRLWPTLTGMLPESRMFPWTMGCMAGVTTMLANAAGPVLTIYLLARRLPKHEFVGTAAVFFFLINLIKVPFSAHLGLIDGGTLWVNAMLVPAVVAGLFAGRKVLGMIPQRVFEELLLGFSALAALRMLW